jgi:predicted dehydrogenase
MHLIECKLSPALATTGKGSHSRPLRAAVIGIGKISEAHLSFLNGSETAQLLAVCDLSPSLAEYACRRFGPAQPYTDYQRMLADIKPDVVHVLTPAHTHGRIIRDCLEAGAHVIAEKPIALTHCQFRSLWSVAQRCNQRLIEDHNYRFNHTILRMEQLVAEGRLGTVRDVEVRMALGIREPGNRYADPHLPHPSHQLPCGVVHEFITHLCYLLLRFVPKVDRVAAAWSNHGGGELFRYDDLDALVIGDSVHGRIRFSAVTRPECFSVIVRGTRGWAETDLFQPYLRVVVPRAGGSQLSPLVNHMINGLSLLRASVAGFRSKVMQRTPLEGVGTFLGRSYQSLLESTPPPVTFEDMDDVSRLVDRLLDGEHRL